MQILYTYTYRESIQEEINFISKSFQQFLYQLHISNKILLPIKLTISMKNK